jgi:uncharacterized protein YbaR (Trm112 family)
MLRSSDAAHARLRQPSAARLALCRSSKPPRRLPPTRTHATGNLGTPRPSARFYSHEKNQHSQSGGGRLTDSCVVCRGERWVCENHPDKPWNASGCECGAGAPCPGCNAKKPRKVPALPIDFVPHGFRPTSRNDHFAYCKACRQWFDVREAVEVLLHQTHASG